MRFVVDLPMLAARFLWQLIVSGFTTAWWIIRPGRRPVPALVRMRYSNLDDVGVTVLGCLISLTPGTTTVDVDTARGELLLHMLDASDPAGAVAGIRKEFEAPLQRLFPAKERHHA